MGGVEYRYAKDGATFCAFFLTWGPKHGGTLYHYKGVSAEKFEQFKTSESIGSFLGKNIKGHHDFTKIIEKKE